MANSGSPLPHPHDNVEPLDYKEQFQGREPSKFVDPCEGASKASLKCAWTISRLTEIAKQHGLSAARMIDEMDARRTESLRLGLAKDSSGYIAKSLIYNISAHF
ncbi:hypothetical protein DFH06DRAFT_678811 [Mycena polygramma]|nr:hypothetical protein DFH06DRAFT_678811 [Mycena polygramma]